MITKKQQESMPSKCHYHEKGFVLAGLVTSNVELTWVDMEHNMSFNILPTYLGSWLARPLYRSSVFALIADSGSESQICGSEGVGLRDLRALCLAVPGFRLLMKLVAPQDCLCETLQTYAASEEEFSS